MGGVGLTEEFLASDPPKKEQIRRLEGAIGELLGGVVDEIRILERWKLELHQEIFRLAFGRDLIVETVVRGQASTLEG